jgi:hypothetical protein
MRLMFVIIFLKEVMQRTNTKGFEDKQLLGEQITYAYFTHIIKNMMLLTSGGNYCGRLSWIAW